jgi:hypothetical protein
MEYPGWRYFMILEQTVDIPPTRKLFIDVPPEIPTGKAVITIIPAFEAAARSGMEHAEDIWDRNRANPEKLKAILQKLQGSLCENSFVGLDGVEYQRKVRDEWDN